MKKKQYLIGCILILCLIVNINGCGSKNASTDTVAETEAITNNESESREQESTTLEDKHNYDITLAFAGDINFDKSISVMRNYIAHDEDITECISQDLINDMRSADIMWINNEFTYTTRGTALANKAYTFRADPSRVNILKELGVDIVGLANNHVYDFGEVAFNDTLDTLNKAEIPYVGAGMNIEEAMKPVYFTVQGKKIAYVAASRAEKNKFTPQATEEKGGILRCYDTELFISEIKEAKKNADYVIALVHWGTEYSTVLEQAQITTAKEYIDAGADAIIGAHTHCLQGMEFYKGKPIVYSLGNFWFNSKTLDTMLLQLRLTGNDDEQNVELKIIPALQKNMVTKKLTNIDEQHSLFSRIEEISIDVTISDEGIVSNAK